MEWKCGVMKKGGTGEVGIKKKLNALGRQLLGFCLPKCVI